MAQSQAKCNGFQAKRSLTRRRCAAGILIILIGLLISLMLVSLSARADAAPPDFPPGTNPQPGSEVTQVRMISETVVLDIRATAARANPVNCFQAISLSNPRSVRAHVEAVFQMHNLGSSAEHLAVRFPLNFWNGRSDRDINDEITDLKVEVAGRPVTTTKVSNAPRGVRQGGSFFSWATFDVVFPPGQDVPIKVFYTTDGACTSEYIAFGYVLETGAGWKDTIGRADLIVRLPYNANRMNIADFTGFSRTSPGAMLSGRELRWHFENLEPTTADNLEVSLVWPGEWQQILAKQQEVQNHPDDGEAWGRLGKAYKELLHCSEKAGIRSDEGGQELYRLSVAAYEKAVTLLPRDALWHAGFAGLLMCHYAYSYPEREAADMIRGLDELNRSVALAPDNQPAQNLITWGQQFFPDEIKLGPNGYYFLTPTPRPLPTFTLTPAPPTATPTTKPHQERDTATATVPATVHVTAPTLTMIPTASSASKAPATSTGSPGCGAGLALPMMIILGVVLGRGRVRRRFER